MPSLAVPALALLVALVPTGTGVTPSWPAAAGGAAAPIPGTAHPVPGVSAGDRAVWPLISEPTVVAPFDPPLSAYGQGHRGVDLAGKPGQRVVAAAAGRVTYAGRLAGRGVVVVSHGTTRTTYEPVRSSVSVGKLVGAGEMIGRLETAGTHCPPAACLHWGLIQGETYLDPLTLVGAGPVRLLPQWRSLTPVGAPVGRPDGAGRW